MKIKIVEAQKQDKEFILSANQEIDDVSCIKCSKLSENVESDIFGDKKAVCMIAKDKNKNVGMVLFSKVYWADRGEGIYVSQAFVSKKYRQKGILKMLIKEALNYYESCKFMTCLVSKENKVMQECMKKLSFEDEGMVSYAKNIEDFVNL